jgi:hypothetical protein
VEIENYYTKYSPGGDALMKLIGKRILGLICLCALMALSCNILQILSPGPDADGTPDSEPTNFVVPSAIPSAIPSKPCPVTSSTPAPTLGPESFDIVSSITAYLNAGGSLDSLENSIEELALLIQETPSLIEADFDGNGLNDLIVSILQPSEEIYPLSGQSMVYLCHETTYQLVYSTPQNTQIGIPRFYSIDDLSGDGLTDVILGIETCGAHTCFTSIEGLVWTGETFENRLQGTSEDLPSPTIEINQEPTEIIVTGEGVASVGAGPNRSIERHWFWDNDLQSFVPSEDVLLPSDYRIHILHDADKALLQGEIEAAIESYARVIGDEQLLDWVDPDIERANLAAFASFKIILAHIHSGDLDGAESALGDLQESYPEETIGASFRAMAEIFWDEYVLNNDLVSSCHAAQRFAEENAGTIVESLYFGYGNQVYTAQDLCPIVIGNR